MLEWDDDGGQVVIELEEVDERHAAAGRREHARVRDRARAARARVSPGGVDGVFAALGDPGRRSLVEAVAGRGTATATELAAELPVTRQAVAKQLATLADAGPPPGDARGPGDALRGDAAPLEDAVAWMVEVGAAWDDRSPRCAQPRASLRR